MMDFYQEHEYQQFMDEGKSMIYYAELSESRRDYLTAKSRYFSAATSYQNAARFAEKYDEIIKQNEAKLKYDYCLAQACEMVYKYDDAMRENEL